MTLEECAASTGKTVIYKACRHCNWASEKGVIVSAGEVNVFVRFGSPTPKACNPADLTLVTPSGEVTA